MYAAAALVTITGLVMRLWALRTQEGALNSDEAVVGLMALHIQSGDIATMYWGQAYGGPHEALLVAALFAIGVGAVALEIVGIGLHAAAAIVLWRIGLRTVGRRAAFVAALLFWVWPAAAVLVSLRTFALYGSGVLLASLVLLQVLRLADDGIATRREQWLLLGLVFGLGVWATPQFAWVGLPAVAWLWWHRRPGAGACGRVALGFLVGAAPWVWYGATNQWDTLKAPPQGSHGTGYVDHLTTFFREGLPVALGLKAPLHLEWIPGEGLALILLVVATVAFAVAVIRRVSGAGVLITVAAAYPFLLALSTHTWYQADGRYLYLLMPTICLLVARALVALRAETVGVALAAVLTIAGLHAVAEPQVDYGALESALRAHDITRAYADYWIAYRVTFDTREDVIVTPAHGSRHAPYDAAVRAADRPAFIYRQGDVNGVVLAARALAAGATPESFAVGDFIVYVPTVHVDPP